MVNKILHNLEQLIIVYANSGYSILEIFTGVVSPILEHYRIPIDELKADILKNRDINDLQKQAILNQLLDMKHINPKNAKEELKKMAVEKSKEITRKQLGDDDMGDFMGDDIIDKIALGDKGIAKDMVKDKAKEYAGKTLRSDIGNKLIDGIADGNIKDISTLQQQVKQTGQDELNKKLSKHVGVGVDVDILRDLHNVVKGGGKYQNMNKTRKNKIKRKIRRDIMTSRKKGSKNENKIGKFENIERKENVVNIKDIEKFKDYIGHLNTKYDTFVDLNTGSKNPKSNKIYINELGVEIELDVKVRMRNKNKKNKRKNRATEKKKNEKNEKKTNKAKKTIKNKGKK